MFAGNYRFILLQWSTGPKEDISIIYILNEMSGMHSVFVC